MRALELIPDVAARFAETWRHEIDYDYCKGCGICVSECPCGAIETHPEPS